MKIVTPYRRRKARIEIIPLIDIIFFLLATFVMVSMSMVKNSGVVVRLPTAVTGSAQDRKSTATISITQNGDIYLDKVMITIGDLKEKLKTLKANDPELTVFISGDTEADFGKAIEVLDEVRLLGITKVAIQTRKPQ